MSLRPWLNTLLLAGGLLAAAGCQSVAGTAGELPLAAVHDGTQAWILAYSAEPHEAAATEIEWRLYRLEGGKKVLAWAAPGMQPEWSPIVVSAQLVTRPSDAPVAWIAANYPGGQYRIHRIDDGAVRFWRVEGNRVAPTAAGLHVTESPDGTTWVTYEQPRYWDPGDPDRELLELDAEGSSRVLHQDVLWAACHRATCTVLYETGDSFVIEENGVATAAYAVGTRYSAPLRAVCKDPQSNVILVTEENAYPLAGEPDWPEETRNGFTRNGDGSVALPQAIRQRFISDYGRLVCDDPGTWLWISDSEEKTYQIGFTTGTVTPLQNYPDSPNFVAYRTPNQWYLVGALYQETESRSCDSPREMFRTCFGEYDRFSLATFPLAPTTAAP